MEEHLQWYGEAAAPPLPRAPSPPPPKPAKAAKAVKLVLVRRLQAARRPALRRAASPPAEVAVALGGSTSKKGAKKRVCRDMDSEL